MTKMVRRSFCVMERKRIDRRFAVDPFEPITFYRLRSFFFCFFFMKRTARFRFVCKTGKLVLSRLAFCFGSLTVAFFFPFIAGVPCSSTTLTHRNAAGADRERRGGHAHPPTHTHAHTHVHTHTHTAFTADVFILRPVRYLWPYRPFKVVLGSIFFPTRKKERNKQTKKTNAVT